MSARTTVTALWVRSNGRSQSAIWASGEPPRASLPPVGDSSLREHGSGILLLVRTGPRHGVHAKPMRQRDYVWPVLVLAAVISLIVGAIGFYLAPKSQQAGWAVPLGIGMLGLLVWIAISKLRSERPETPDLRFILLGVACASGGVGLAATGGDHPTLLGRLIGIVIACVGGLALAAESRNIWLLTRR